MSNKEKEKHSVSVDLKSTMVDDSSELSDAITHLFYSHFSEVLNILSARFPHIKDDGSVNEKEYKGLRAKVLRSGNNQIRQMTSLFDDYDVVRTHDTVVERLSVNTPVITDKG